jgi:3-deoxy-7-phosphoheptulonate synthase
VLRGGAGGPNYFLHDLYRASKLITTKGLANPAILVDASHDNCKMDGVKHPGVQADVVREVLSNLRVHPELLATVKGFMIESFLKGGSQSVESLTCESVDRGGLSITDPCLSWPETKALLADLASQVADLRASQVRRAASS